jgi:hypothetical protein
MLSIVVQQMTARSLVIVMVPPPFDQSQELVDMLLVTAYER